MKIGIIGGGASGMISAIVAAKRGSIVTIIEHKSRIGNKLLLTGSGKCNISNEDMDLCHFHGNDLSLLETTISKYNPQYTLNFLKELGLITKSRNGYLYPYSEQAASVLDVLRFALRDLNVNIITDTEVKSCKKNVNSKHDSFMVDTTNGQFVFDRLIIACGSKSYKKTGSDGSGYAIAKNFGHNIIKPLPALTFLNCEEDFYNSIAGIRTKASISLYSGKKEFCASQSGELQITKTGISGIPVFNLSYIASKLLDSNKQLFAIIDFFPDFDENQLREILTERINRFPNRSLEELFLGMIHKNIGICILKRSGFKLSDKVKQLSSKDIDNIINSIKGFRTNIISTGGFDNAQVCLGGVDASQIKNTMESKLVDGLYFVGEIIDINGDCGGYNLQWAVSSGINAGINSTK